MVCAKCEKKTRKTAASDPFRNRDSTNTLVASSSKSKGGPSVAAASGSGSVAGARPVGQNKLLGSKNRYNPTSSKCKVCKSTVSQERAIYCQGCAYKRGLCSICGKQILDISNYKQSS